MCTLWLLQVVYSPPASSWPPVAIRGPTTCRCTKELKKGENYEGRLKRRTVKTCCKPPGDLDWTTRQDVTTPLHELVGAPAFNPRCERTISDHRSCRLEYAIEESMDLSIVRRKLNGHESPNVQTFLLTSNLPSQPGYTQYHLLKQVNEHGGGGYKRRCPL